ncbi:DEAD/DEAH box helicase [Sorangium sp. So ce887]|uniref:DEAD/DEAH box helicase n=1 Tax=Sorangium sp. So ce887 TaxID=3133324 RepID=UPI003F61C347
MSSSVLAAEDAKGYLDAMLRHRGPFSSLDAAPKPEPQSETQARNVDLLDVVDADVSALAMYQHGHAARPTCQATGAAARLASYLSLGLTRSEVESLIEVIQIHSERAVRAHVSDDLFELVRRLSFPTELFPAQITALNSGLLDNAIDSWGFAAPTGTGKTFVTRLLILDYLRSNIGGAALYVVPSRALVHEITKSLREFFDREGVEVASISPQITRLTTEEEQRLASKSVIVMTPEKADLLLRLSTTVLDRMKLVVVDEAHHIESGTRGALLEFCLWRLRRLAQESTRIVVLSAVAPNIADIARWLGTRPRVATSDVRSTRMRAGIYRIKKTGRFREGWIDYADGSSVRLFERALATTDHGLLVQLADRINAAGPVLIVASGKKECEKIAAMLVEWKREHGTLRSLSAAELASDHIARLDSRLEREMYANVSMRSLLKHRIAYHHAGLPPRVRIAVEEAIRMRLIDFVCATTTLAEGVNFPFSSLIVQSVAIREAPEKGRPVRYHPVTPRSFWNIAGRAGRPGVDKEGQAILFEPSLGLERTKYVIGAYTDSSLSGLDPVRSALGEAIAEIHTEFAAGRLDLTTLDQEALPRETSKAVQGTVNLARVALIHSSASGVLATPKEMVEGTLAFSQMTKPVQEFAVGFFERQNQVVDRFFAARGAPSRTIVAELGLSLQTLSNLRAYVQSLDDWKLSRMANVLRGGQVDLRQAAFVVGPVAKRMAELEGPELGGIYSEVAVQWISGVPLTYIDKRAQFRNWSRLEDLISVMYSRVQFLLPWGLFAFDRLVEEEDNARGIVYGNEIKTLSYLADAGVPSLDALRLVGLDFERVDAARLASEYHRKGGKSLGVDVVGWMVSQPITALERAVLGVDSRRIDYDFRQLVSAIRLAASS